MVWRVIRASSSSAGGTELTERGRPCAHACRLSALIEEPPDPEISVFSLFSVAERDTGEM
jgi:hypothetical protein